MIIEIKVPSPGESITEVQIARWLKKEGEYVEEDDELCEIDSDKATLTVNAEKSGVLSILVNEGDTVKVGDIVCKIDTSASAPKVNKSKQEEAPKTSAPAPTPTPIEKVAPIAEPTAKKTSSQNYASGTPSPAAKKMMDENKIPATSISGSGKDGRITKSDVLNLLSAGFKPSSEVANSREIDRQKMSALRKKLSQRLVAVKNETAMLTTFNEVDMSAIMSIRSKYKDAFKEKFGVNIGFMSFFTKAVTEALQLYPAVNAMIDGDEIIYHKYCDISIAVSAPKGLVVPVIRNAENMSLAEIENSIKTLALKARENKITIEEMTGGTFTITNGGVFGSMMSTPIINPPQSAILGMHNVVERPMAINGEVKIRPMMYVALSYDHRIIDGRESVGFLVKVKEMLENPVKMLFGSKSPEEILLNL
ncbi:MAG: 2-oxoglutarate dehydrogenase complex dihydrolipoyllysine-residue succinyltransferase [Bacteroidia bacterium]|nr:2-oxoglutarate dehydrogenase complex dihydrolipoyllysine-residue succinyltransferase [Bacteroidia bacterium]MCZ2249793.1 2-oxoglutarate dehydrogenase complex dihydrolipoyllysine-residue succinyltransferase [Bacteroidia bacterium]